MKLLKGGLVAGLAVVAAGSSILAWQQYVELAALRGAALGGSGSADDVVRLRDLERRNRELQGQLDALRGGAGSESLAQISTEARPGGPARSERGARGGGRGGPGGDAGGMRASLENPQVQALRAVQQRGELDNRYAALFKSLGLPADQIEKFKSLLSERQATTLDVMAAAREQGIDPRQNPEEFRRLLSAAQGDIDQSMQAVLGETGFAQYQTYEQTAPQRNVVAQLEQRLSYTEAPLTGAQSQELVRILAATASPTTAAVSSPVEAREGRGFGGMGGRGPAGSGNAAAITTAAVTQAQAVLSLPQMAALHQLQAQQQAQQQLQQAMHPGPAVLNKTSGANPAARGGGN